VPAVDYDVIVIGLGVMGASALWRLSARPGVRVAGIEQYEPGHTRGASHGESRIFRTAYMEGESYVPLMRAARGLWAELEREAGAALLLPTGCLTIGPPDLPAILGAVASARTHDLAYELLSTAALADRYPQHAALPGATVALWEPAAGVIRPEAAVAALVSSAVARGARVVSGAVSGIDGRSVRLADRVLTARHVVVAAGGWTGGLVPELAPVLRPVRRVQGWFPVRRAGDFGLSRFPVFLRETGGAVWYGMPSLDGATVKVAVHYLSTVDEPVDPTVGPRAPDGADAAVLADLVSTGLPGLEPRAVRLVPCTYTLTPDQDFMIGQRVDRPHTTVLCGFSGHGFKFAPLVGEVAAELALTGETSYPVGLFDPHRYDDQPSTPRRAT
jgi:sarcosine oxidase